MLQLCECRDMKHLARKRLVALGAIVNFRFQLRNIINFWYQSFTVTLVWFKDILFTCTLRVCSFRRIQKRIFDLRFARFCGRKEREIRNWICNLGNLSPTRAICMTASQEMTCFLLFDKLCDYTVQNLVVGSSNSDDGTYKTGKERSALKLKII